MTEFVYNDFSLRTFAVGRGKSIEVVNSTAAVIGYIGQYINGVVVIAQQNCVFCKCRAKSCSVVRKMYNNERQQPY